MDRLKKYKEEVEQKKKELNRAEGAIAEIKRRLKDDYGMTAKKARKQLPIMEQQERELEQTIEDGTKAFEKKFKDKL